MSNTVTRRTVLAGTAATVATAIAPMPAVAAVHLDFMKVVGGDTAYYFPAHAPVRTDYREIGNAINYGFVEDGGEGITINVDPIEVARALHEDAAKTLPANMRYELRAKVPTNYGRSKGMSWYRNDAMDATETWGDCPATPRYIEDQGCRLVGQFVTPAAA